MQIMRDATIDHRQVRLPNASHLGYDKWKAQRGDVIVYREGEGTRTGRVLGRVAYAPPEGEIGAITDHLYVLALSDDLSHAYIRWVDPADVVQCTPCTPDRAAWLALFFAADLPRDLPDLCAYGIHADLSDDHRWPCTASVERRRRERTERGITVDPKTGLVPSMKY
jgi:hypothetical protein